MKINGSLVFDASSASQIQNLRLEKFASATPTWTAADQGRVVFVTATNTIFYGTDSAFVSLATGGNAYSQAYGDNLEASLGAGVSQVDGSFNAGAFDSPIATATSFTNAINQLAAYATSNNELHELDDVSVGTRAAGDYLKYNGTVWVNDVLTVADVTDLTVSAAQINNAAATTATTAELDTLDGITALVGDLNLLTGAAAGTGAFAGAAISSTEISYLDGVTSNIQTQLNGLQSEDDTLTGLAGLNGTGIVVGTAVDAFDYRTLVAPAAGVTITNADGVAGNPTFALANDLAALEGLATNGYIVRTADGAAATRTIVGTAGNIVVTNGDGIASDTSLNLGTVSQAATGDFVKVTLDTFGRVTGNTPVVTADITALVDATYVNVSGDVMTGDLGFSGTHTVTSLREPTAINDAATKGYVDSVAAGLSWKNAVRAATTANVALVPAPAAIDGVTLASGDRVLVKNQTAAAENGIYTFDGTDLVRSTDMDAAAEFAGATVFVTEGTANADSGWTQTAEVATLGTTAVAWSQFSGSSTYLWGVGLEATGNTVNINLGSGIFEGPTDAVGIDLHDKTTGALILTTNGTDRENPLSLDGELYLLLQATGGLAQAADGLRINAAGVTNAMLVNQGVTTNGDTGTGTLNLGGELEIAGTSVQGITTSVAGSVFTISASDASAVQKGVASFDATEFTVTAGNVVLGTIGNSKLANSTFTVAGTTGSDAVALGETLTVVGGAGGEVSTAVTANQVAVSVRDATVSLKGVASFNADHFSVTAGAVDLAATLDDLTNVSSADTAATGDLLTKTAGDWSPVSRDAIVGSTSIDAHSDVTVTTAAAGQTLIWNGTAWVNRKIYHTEAFGTPSTTWTVNHALGQKFCNVTIADASDEVVIPQSITFVSATQLTVTFNTAIAGQVMVTGVNAAA